MNNPTNDLQLLSTLSDMQAYVARQCQKRGWDTRSDLERLAMLLEEVGEVAKEVRRRQGNMGYKQPETAEHLAEELVDALNFIIDLANSNHIDLTDAFKKKWESVQTRRWETA